MRFPSPLTPYDQGTSISDPHILRVSDPFSPRTFEDPPDCQLQLHFPRFASRKRKLQRITSTLRSLRRHDRQATLSSRKGSGRRRLSSTLMGSKGILTTICAIATGHRPSSR